MIAVHQWSEDCPGIQVFWFIEIVDKCICVMLPPVTEIEHARRCEVNPIQQLISRMI